MILATELHRSNAQLRHARNALTTARIDLHTATSALKEAESDAMIQGKVVGKNAEERKASLNDITTSERKAVHFAERRVLEAEGEHEVARLEWRLACELNRLGNISETDTNEFK